MKTYFCYLLFFGLLITQNLNGQSKLSPWSMEFHYTPQYVDYYAPQRGAFLPTESPLRPGYSFTLGLGVYRQLNSRFSLSTGLAFFSTVSESLDKELRLGNEHNGNGAWGGPDPNNPSRLSFQEHFYFLQFPLQAQVYLSTGKWRCYVKSGVQLEYLLARRTASQQIYYDGIATTTHTLGDYDPLRNYNAIANLGFGLEWTRKCRQTFFLEPEARMTLLGVSPDAPFATRRYDLGMRTGMRFRFARK